MAHPTVVSFDISKRYLQSKNRNEGYFKTKMSIEG